MRGRVGLSLFSLFLLATCLTAAPRPGPFRFCYGLEDPAAFSIIRTLGLNTYYLQLSLARGTDLEPIRQQIREAAGAGLSVIVELPTLLSAPYRVSPWDEKYVGSVRELIGHLVRQLGEEPGLTAWATASWLERALHFRDEDFRAFLQERYPDLETLNAQWGTQFPTWASLTMSAAKTLEQEAPYGVGRARVDLADYQAEAYRRVMAIWLAAIRAVDARRPVLTGRVTLYRSLLSIPEGYDVVCVAMPPDILEPDLLAHNVHALDLARRRGKFHVLPVFRVPDNASPAYVAESLRDWMNFAALHGAIGFGLEDWRLLEPLYTVEQRASERGRHLLNAIRAAAAVPCAFTPQPSLAVLYSPYASGFDVTRQPVYGYLLDYLVGEPSELIFALRLGTRYGLVDYLSVDDLRDVDLSRYGCVLAPACLNLPPEAARLLANYVWQGGALLADLGLGAYQTGAWTTLPEALQAAFGIAELGNARERFGELIAAEGLPALAPWPRGLKAGGTFIPKRGATASAAERRGYPVSGWTAEAVLQEGAAPIATLSVRYNEAKQPVFAGIVGRSYGAGLALFATHPLWQHWPLVDELAQILHDRLFRRRATYELLQEGLLQSGPYFAGNAEAVALFNPAKKPVLVQLWAHTAQSYAFSPCATGFLATPGAEGLRPGAALLTARLGPQEMQIIRRTGLLVQPYSDAATVIVREYSPARVSVELGGTESAVRLTPKGLELDARNAASVRFVLRDGVYHVAPRSSHVVTIRARTREKRLTLSANEHGELDLSDTYPAGATIVIEPLEPSPKP